MEKRLYLNKDILLLIEKPKLLILYNTKTHKTLFFTRGIHFVKSLLEKIDKGQITFSSTLLRDELPLLNYFRKFNFISNQNKTLNPLPVKHDYNADFTSKKTKISLYLLLTNKCNLRCVYCCLNEKKNVDFSDNKMSKEVAYKAIEKFSDFIAENGTLQIIFFGGEPMLNSNLALDIINYCQNFLNKKYNIRYQYHFTTNLTFIPNNLINDLKKTRCTFLIDVDGLEKTHNKCRPFINGEGSFNSILKNINILKNNNIPFGLRSTVTSMNVDQLFEMAWFFKTLNAKSVAFPTINPFDSEGNLLPTSLIPNSETYANELLKLIRKPPFPLNKMQPIHSLMLRIQKTSFYPFSCGMASGTTPIIDVNGDIFPCLYYIRPSYKLGNVLNNDSFNDLSFFCNQLENKSYVYLPRCRDCSVKFICKGGCPVKFDLYENLNNPNINIDSFYNLSCTHTKKLIDEIIYTNTLSIINKK